MLSTTCCNVVLNNLLQCCAAPYQQLLLTSIVHSCWNNYCSPLTNQQGVNNVVETAQNNVITVLLNAWQINKAWTTLLEQLRSTWYHSSFILSTTANITVSTIPVRGLFSGGRKIFSTLIFFHFVYYCERRNYTLTYIDIYK